MKRLWTVIVSLFVLTAFAAEPDKSENKKRKLLSADTFQGLELRSIGPAVTSGRIIDLAVHPKNPAVYYVAVASGGVWKTTNSGTTWSPIFDTQGSYSIGCITMDPKDPLVVWVGTGENNSQRSVGYGDGIYRSLDGGKKWENMGLKNSEHIGKIIVDPRDSNVIYVAAQGPLWAPGGDRGLYKSTDRGKTWNQILKISENTGVTDIAYDPRNPDVLYAASYQRRRHVWTLINGGPESDIYKSTDAGASWKKLERGPGDPSHPEIGLPKVDLGRIALAVASSNPDIVYALVETAGKEGGFYRSTDAGGSWVRQSDYMSNGPMYYQEIFVDPNNVDRIYSMDTWMMVTDDAGKTFRKVGEKYKHVDNHALWINPQDSNHLLAGCDGGVYESFDRGAAWEFKSNLPVTQFYRVSVDNTTPFYYVYGGTQDNQTLGGPSRTRTAHGIMNSDWFVTIGGDGFWSAVDPEDPNIVYSEYQYGGLMRFDRKTGEKIDIQPQPAKGEEPLRWNWDSPLILSPHSHVRLYFAANKVFCSDDRGDNWKVVSPDLTRRIDRNKLKVMGRVWSVDSIAKSQSTSFYGNIVSLAESPLKEGLLFVGTDDGLIQISEDGGTNWRIIQKFPGIPDLTHVSRITPSVHDAGTLFAAFNNHKTGDFKPYLLKSTDLGKTWISIKGDLPERGSVWSLVQDHEDPDLLFCGTEFGLFFTVDSGKRWIQLKGNFPIIPVRDLAIQKRENDLVVGTFGRGFYILDDYSPLRRLTESTLAQEAVLFPVKPAWMYIPEEPLGLKEKSFLGDSLYTAPNPPFGAIFTYYLKDELKTRKKIRQDKEKELIKGGKDVEYPTWEELRAEDREEEPIILVTVSDEAGNVVRQLTGPVTEGFHRVAWDLRYPPADPTKLSPPPADNPFEMQPIGALAAPGSYRVSISKRVDGKVTSLAEPQSLTTAPLGTASLPAPDRAALLAFQKKTARLQRAVLGAVEVAREAKTRMDSLKKALDDTPGIDPKLSEESRNLIVRLLDIQKAVSGDETISRRNEPTPPSLVNRVQGVVSGHWTTTSAPTGTHLAAYDIAAAEFAPVLEQLRILVEQDLRALEDKAEAAGAPWTPGRVPRWKRE